MQATGLTLTLHGRAVTLDPRIARRALAREVRGMSIGLRLWLAGLSVVVAVAAVAALIALPPGWEVLGTSPSFEWGLLIVGYVFFAIMTSGLCLASSLGTVFGIERFRPLEKRHAILAVLSLTTAFGIIALDLHYPVRMVFGAVLVPSPTSPMWWMGVFYGIYLVVLLVEVWSMFFHHPRIHQYACTAATCTAVLAPATLGAVFGVLAAKAFWSGPFTVLMMVAAAYLAGTALLGIVFYAVVRLGLQEHERARDLAIPSLRLLLSIALILVSVLLVRQIVVGLTDGTPGLREATAALVTGPLAVPFWVLRVITGLAIPLVLVLLPATRTPLGLLAASVLALGGVFVDRVLFVVAGQIAPLTAHAGTVSSPFTAYVPSPVEIAIIAGAIALFALVYTLVERYLDMGEDDEHINWPWPWLRHAEPEHVAEDEGAPAHALLVTAGPVAASEPALTAMPAAPPESQVTAPAELEPTPEPAAEPESTAEPTIEPELAIEPESTPEPVTAEPVSTPEPAVEPESTAELAAEPEPTRELATAEPDSTPEPVDAMTPRAEVRS